MPNPSLLRHPILLFARLTIGRLVLAVFVNARIDPAAAGSGAIVLQIGEAADSLLVCPGIAVDLFEHSLRTGFVVLAVCGVIPGEIEQRAIFRIGGCCVQLAQPAAQMIDEVQFTARIARRFDRFMMPLQQALRIGEAAFLFSVRCGREEEDFGSDVFGFDLATPMLGRVFPELRRLDHRQIAHHAPFQIAHSLALHRGMRRTHRGILTHDEVALHCTIDHVDHRGHMRVVAGEAWQVIEAPAIRLLCGIAIPGLQERHDVLLRFAPPTRNAHFVFAVRVEVGVLLRARHGEIAGQQVEQRGDVG